MLDARLNERRGKRAPHHDTRPLAAVKLVEDVAVGAERLGARLEKGRGVDACVQEGLQCGAVQHVAAADRKPRSVAAPRWTRKHIPGSTLFARGTARPKSQERPCDGSLSAF